MALERKHIPYMLPLKKLFDIGDEKFPRSSRDKDDETDENLCELSFVDPPVGSKHRRRLNGFSAVSCFAVSAMMPLSELGTPEFSSFIGDDVENCLFVPVFEERWKLSGDAISIVVVMGRSAEELKDVFCSGAEL